MEEGSVTALTLLDLSAAFDTLDHSCITNLLATWYGIDGIALEWFVSYLSDRKQTVYPVLPKLPRRSNIPFTS